MTRKEGSPVGGRTGMDLDRKDIKLPQESSSTNASSGVVGPSQLESQQPKRERMVFRVASGVVNAAVGVAKENKLSCGCCVAGCATCLAGVVLSITDVARESPSNVGISPAVMGGGIFMVGLGAVLNKQEGNSNQNRPSDS